MNLFHKVSDVADPFTVVREVAQILVPGVIETVEPVAGGRNSRVFRVETKGQTFALKQYPRTESKSLDRMGAEVAALEFLFRHGVFNVPRVVAKGSAYRCALYTWIDGDPVLDPTDADMDAVLRLVSKLVLLGHAEDANAIGNASAATFTGGEVLNQVERRLVRFRNVGDTQPDLKNFLENKFKPVFRDVSAWARNLYNQKNIEFDALQPGRSGMLSPSDFGFHNTLRQPNGALGFVDFEYFGWDDSVKLISDFLLHPGMDLSLPLKIRFLKGASKIFGVDDEFFELRLKALYPLYGLIWCLILLNEFLPEHAHREELLGVGTSWKDAKAHQLQLAKTALQNIEDTYEYGPIVG